MPLYLIAALPMSHPICLCFHFLMTSCLMLLCFAHSTVSLNTSARRMAITCYSVTISYLS